MSNSKCDADAKSEYILGHSEREIARLKAQAAELEIRLRGDFFAKPEGRPVSAKLSTLILENSNVFFRNKRWTDPRSQPRSSMLAFGPPHVVDNSNRLLTRLKTK